jgi:CheY-like chemotaxis protein
VPAGQTASDGLAALDTLRRYPIDAAVIDNRMPGMNGVELIAAVRARRRLLPAILLTGHVGDIAVQAPGAVAAGSFVVLQKPIRPSDLAERVARAFREAPT